MILKEMFEENDDQFGVKYDGKGTNN